jgi:dsRNA-specific ribonuclease
MAHAYALAAELAQPVDAGYLTPSEALAALLVAALAAERGSSYRAPAIFRLQRHLFAQRLGQLTVQRQIAEGKERLQNWRQRHG